MKNLPSVKTLKLIAFERAAELRAVLECRSWNEFDALLPKYPGTDSWIRGCYNRPTFQHAKLSIADEILGNCGVEYISPGTNDKSPAIEYSNTGDTYGLTLMWTRGRYVVGDWGTIVERGNYA